MKQNIHPVLKYTKVICRGCSNEFDVLGQLDRSPYFIEVCSNCHSAYTGKRKILSAGAIDKFKKRYKNLKTDD